jgi:hypothetical protein
MKIIASISTPVCFKLRDGSRNEKVRANWAQWIFIYFTYYTNPARSDDAARLPRSCTPARAVAARGPNKFLRCPRCWSGSLKILAAALASAFSLSWSYDDEP